MSKKSPQLRFEGFTDDWEERKFSNLAEVRRGLTYKPSDVQKYGIRVLRSSNIAEDTFLIKSDDVFVNKEAVKIDKVKNGDILITSANGSSRLVGKHALIEGIENDTVHGGFMLVARAEKPEFVNAIMSSSWYSKFINIFVSGGNGAIGNLSKSNLEDQKVYVPSEIEQTKIGLFFKGLDDTIALHQRKLDLLKEQKKGYLQKMFSKNGAKVPELRFAGFADDWEERKLGDVVGEIQSGNRLPKDSLTSGNIPYVVAQTKNEGVFKTISKKTLDYNGNPMKLFPGNSISFSIDNPEAMFYRSTEFYTSNIMRVIHADYLSHQQYLFILENMKSFTRGYDWSRKFSGPVVSNLEYLQPNEQEQCKIGSFILAFDNIITLHQRKLDLLKEQKKGLLQKMFV